MSGFPNITIATSIIQLLMDLPNDEQGLTAEQLKYAFDKFPTEFVTWWNANIAGKGAMLTDLQGVVLGQIPNGTLTEAKMANDMKKQAGGVAKYDDLASGWLMIPDECKYVNAAQLIIEGDWRNRLQKGDFFRCVQGREFTNSIPLGGGTNVSLNMSDTSGFNVGNTVTVESLGLSETAKVTAVSENVSITVDALQNAHANQKWVSCVKHMIISAAPTYSAENENTTLDVTGGSDFTLGTGYIETPAYSRAANPYGWPMWFNYSPTCGATTPMTWGGAASLAKFRVVNGECTVVLTASGTTGGTAHHSLLASLPIPYPHGATIWPGGLGVITDDAPVIGRMVVQNTNIFGQKPDVSNFRLGESRSMSGTVKYPIL